MHNYRFFKINEFDCSHTGFNQMDPEFIRKLDILRERCGFPFVINSGYRDATHPIEAKKAKPGMHSQGIAADIKVNNGIQRRKVVEEALKLDFGGVGVANGFVHVDSRSTTPVMWVY